MTHKFIIFKCLFIIAHTVFNTLNCIAVTLNKDTIFQQNIKTVQLFKSNDPLSNPIIELNGSQKLTLKFDELTDEISNYEYQIIACNADWSTSQMFTYEYIEGFQTANIYDYRLSSSLNAVKYVHYWFEFPNEQIALKKSGNYIINVFKGGYSDSIILTKRFMVFEPLVELDMFIQRPALSSITNTHQEVRFNVMLNRYEIQNPLSEVTVTLMQNFRWDSAKEGIAPVFVNPSMLQFRREGAFAFPALKEYRYFDIRNMLIRNERIMAFSQDKADSVYLFADRPMRNQQYVFIRDINGKYLTGSYPWTSVDWEGMYVNVLLMLKTDAVYMGGDIYVFGQLSDWQLKPEFKMIYDEMSKTYYANILLKQGFYNYFYAYAKTADNLANPSAIEGDFFETENEYEAMVYHRPAGARYDRLIAYKAIDNFGNQRK
jgi:hypothetical protein